MTSEYKNKNLNLIKNIEEQGKLYTNLKNEYNTYQKENKKIYENIKENKETIKKDFKN